MAPRPSGTGPIRLGAEWSIPQDDFIERFWAPEPGEHVSLIGPNGRGKTTLGLKLLGQATDLHPQTIGVAMAMKPDKGPREDGQRRRPTGDETVARLTRALGGRVTRQWRPPIWQRVGRPEPRFWTVWPRHSEDFRADLFRHRSVFEKVIIDCYNKGNRWVFADEIYSLCAELKLDHELIHVWSKGRSMKCAVIGATQRPAMVPRWMYSSARHLFLWKDSDTEARKRYGEISGFDPRLLARYLDALRRFECLYICPERDLMALLTPAPFLPDPRQARELAQSSSSRT